MWYTVLALIMLLGFHPNVWATNYHVQASCSGCDSRACRTAHTPATPKQTIGNARACLSPGDTLFLRGGTYQESLVDGNFPAGTSWSSPVTFKGYPGETAIWNSLPGFET